jgi:hypothetical protein
LGDDDAADVEVDAGVAESDCLAAAQAAQLAAFAPTAAGHVRLGRPAQQQRHPRPRRLADLAARGLDALHIATSQDTGGTDPEPR